MTTPASVLGGGVEERIRAGELNTSAAEVKVKTVFRARKRLTAVHNNAHRSRANAAHAVHAGSEGSDLVKGSDRSEAFSGAVRTK